MKALLPREQRLLAAGLLLCCLAGIGEFIILPIVDGFIDRREALAELSAAYIRNDHVIAGLPAWRMEAEEQAKTAGRFAIVAPTAAVGNEALVQRMSQTVRAAGGTVLSTQKVQSDLPRNWIGIQSDLRLTLSQLTTVLAHFQNEEPYVVVDFLSVGVATRRGPDEPESLAIRLAISTLLRVSPPPAQPRAIVRHA
jgi:hypothetical protein